MPRGAKDLRILLIEDDSQTAERIRSGLGRLGHDVEVARDGRRGLERGSSEAFDVLVVDRLLPELDGIELLKALRTAQVCTPVIMLTAIGGIADRVRGLRAGADDYLVKPFDLEELDARIEALARRPSISSGAITLRRAGLELNRISHTASYQGQDLELTSSEFGMLEVLMMNGGRTVTKSMLLETVFELDSSRSPNVVEPHMSRLRTKLERSGRGDAIRTVRGVGYALV